MYMYMYVVHVCITCISWISCYLLTSFSVACRCTVHVHTCWHHSVLIIHVISHVHVCKLCIMSSISVAIYMYMLYVDVRTYVNMYIICVTVGWELIASTQLLWIVIFVLIMYMYMLHHMYMYMYMYVLYHQSVLLGYIQVMYV